MNICDLVRGNKPVDHPVAPRLKRLYYPDLPHARGIACPDHCSRGNQPEDDVTSLRGIFGRPAHKLSLLQRPNGSLNSLVHDPHLRGSRVRRWFDVPEGLPRGPPSLSIVGQPAVRTFPWRRGLRNEHRSDGRRRVRSSVHRTSICLRRRPWRPCEVYAHSPLLTRFDASGTLANRRYWGTPGTGYAVGGQV